MVNEKKLWKDLHHIGILYTVDLENNKLKSDADGLDSDGANWHDIDSLNLDELSPFAKFAIKINKERKINFVLFGYAVGPVGP